MNALCSEWCIREMDGRIGALYPELFDDSWKWSGPAFHSDREEAANRKFLLL